MNMIKRVLLYPNMERSLRTFDYSLLWLELWFRAFGSIILSFAMFKIIGESWMMYLITAILIVWIISFLFITKEHFEANDA